MRHDCSYMHSTGVCRHLRILHLSDTHMLHRSIEARFPLPEADILIHTGDFTERGSLAEMTDFNDWLGSIRSRYAHILGAWAGLRVCAVSVSACVRRVFACTGVSCVCVQLSSATTSGMAFVTRRSAMHSWPRPRIRISHKTCSQTRSFSITSSFPSKDFASSARHGVLPRCLARCPYESSCMQGTVALSSGPRRRHVAKSRRVPRGSSRFGPSARSTLRQHP